MFVAEHVFVSHTRGHTWSNLSRLSRSSTENETKSCIHCLILDTTPPTPFPSYSLLMTRPHIFTHHIARALSSGRESSCAPLCKLPEIAAASQDLVGGRGVMGGGVGASERGEERKGEVKEKQKAINKF